MTRREVVTVFVDVRSRAGIITYVAPVNSSVSLTFKLSDVSGMLLGLAIVASNGLNVVTFEEVRASLCFEFTRLSHISNCLRQC